MAGRGALAVWAWPVAALAIIAISLAPLFVVDVPALLDYPNHLARFYVLAHPHDPVLSKMYAPHWAVLPNVGMDLFGVALLSVLPVHVGGRILLAISLLAPPAGVALYARTAFGRWTWWSLGVGALAYNGIFILGFLNFELSLGIALTGAAAWRVLRRQGRDRAAVAAGAAIGLAAFFCHLLGYAFFALLIGAEEFEPLLGAWRRRQVSWRPIASAALLLTLALSPAAALYVATHHASSNGDLIGWNWPAKPSMGLLPFMTYSVAGVAITLAVVLGAVVLLRDHARLATGAGLTLAVLIGLFLVAPAVAGGGTYVDARLPQLVVLVLFAGVEMRAPPGLGRMVAAAFAVVIVVRAADVTTSWIGHGRDLADLRAELAYVPPGAKILPAWTGPPVAEQTSGRELPYFVVLNDNLPALAVIERRAFWPLEFTDPAQQPMVLRAPYSSIAQPIGLPAPWTRLSENPTTPQGVEQSPFLKDWRQRYDFVLLTGPPPQARPVPAGLALVRAGEETSLYRVVR